MTLAQLTCEYPMAGVFKRVGRPNRAVDTGSVDPPGPADRATLIPGDYQPTGIDTNPTDATTGVLPGTVLTDYNPSTATAVTIPAGAVITNKKIYGTVTCAGAATFNNSLLVGSPNAATVEGDCIVNAFNTRSGQARFYDCTLKAQKESNGRDCIRGRQFELYRCDLSGGVDGVGISSPSSSIVCAVVVCASYIHDLVFVYPDAIGSYGGHSNPGGGTHNDCIQYQGGKTVTIIGNYLKGTSHHLTGTGTGNTQDWIITAGFNQGACIIMQDNTGAGCDSTVKIQKNFLWGGTSQINIKPTAAGWEYTDNQHHYLACGTPPVAGHWSFGYFIRADTRTALNGVTGLNPNTTNVWIDKPSAVGVALAEPTPSSGIAVDKEI